MRSIFLPATLLCLLAAAPAGAQGFPCKPCAGFRVDDPEALADQLGRGRGPEHEIDSESGATAEAEPFLAAAWEVELDGGHAGTGAGLREAGITPWISLVFRTPPPLLDHLDALGNELERAAGIARATSGDGFFQVLWRPGDEGATSPLEVREYAFLLKRAAVALAGANDDARIVTLPLEAHGLDPRRLYEEEVAAYVDVIAVAEPPGTVSEGFEPSRDLIDRLALMTELDPGKPVVVDSSSFSAEPLEALATAARHAAAGVAMTLFSTPEPSEAQIRALTLLAREFSGDLSFDPYSYPRDRSDSGAGKIPPAWSFVRGEDLGLRVIAQVPSDQLAAGELVIELPDRQLRRPARIDPETLEAIPLGGVRRTESGLQVRAADPGAVAVLRLERPTAAELEGIPGLAEEVTVQSERQMPVEEILRRLQAFEDAQTRKLDHFLAINTTHFRFRFGSGSQTFEATLRGPYFLRRDEPPDWAWKDFFVNGVRWKKSRIPEIPLVQPEKAAALPIEIQLDKTYSYRLKGTEQVAGRDAWAIEFSPSGEGEADRLYRGTVWVDRETFARLKTRGVQLGLEGDVISNEETLEYSPIDDRGAPAAWGTGSYVLPLRRVSRQLLSLLNATVLLEGEALLTEVEINGSNFDDRKAEVAASEVTMVRDTDRGLRYLVADENGDRVVQEDFDTSRFFVVGGIFADDAVDFPVPLAGINYFSFDWKETGNQVNAFFAGPLLTANIADPDFLGSKWDAGADFFAFALPLNNTLFRGDREIFAEEVESRTGNFSLKLGRPLGNYVKVRGEYRLSFTDFGETEETDDSFALPEDHLTHSFILGSRITRGGFQLGLEASFNRRSEWNFWGLPGNAEFDPEAKDYERWGATLSKNWYLPKFQKIGAEVNYVDGSDLDRFSKYGFGQFGDTRVHGYQSGKVRAESAWVGHFTYGFELGELLRIDAIADVALATDSAAGLDDETLAGLGISGTFVGPWSTLVNVDIGTPVAGPDDGFAAFVFFLKLFNK